MALREFMPGEDNDAVLDLRARVWGADHPHTHPEFFRWLFEKTPDGPGSGILAERDGQVIGFAGISRRSGRVGDTPIRISHGLEFMVDPDIGGMLSGRVGVQVLNRHIDHARKLGFDCNLNYPNDKSNRMLTSKRVQYTPVLHPVICLRPLGPVKTDPGFAKGLAYAALGMAATVYSDLKSRGQGRAVEVETISDFDARFDDHWDRLCKDGKMRFSRDAATLNWRYNQNPMHDYTVLAARDGDAIKGFVVLTERDILGTNASVICDLCVADDVPEVQLGLLHAATRAARASGSSLIGTQAIVNSSVARALKRGGFFQIPQMFNPKPFRMLLIANTELGQQTLKGDIWSFAWGDMDVI